MNKRLALTFSLLLLPLCFQAAQNDPAALPEGAAAGRNYRIEASGAIEWEKMELSTTVTLELRSAGIRLPTGRTQAEEIIRREYAAMMRPYILSIPVNSSMVLGDLIAQGEFSFFGPETTAASARPLPPALSADLSRISATWIVDLSLLSAQLARHQRPSEMRRVLSPVPAASYTGIIIIASGSLPVQGRNTAAGVEPCLFPRIWDTEMNLIYERTVLDGGGAGRTIVRYAREESIFLPTPSGLSPELEAFAGSNPLRIIARGVFGQLPTDPVIHRDDALIILSNENNRRLLREGKVVIVLDGGILEKTL